jgi:large subunit ribosomal protein L11
VTEEQVRQIATTKLPDLNAIDLDGALAQVKGTARSMGIEFGG